MNIPGLNPFPCFTISKSQVMQGVVLDGLQCLHVYFDGEGEIHRGDPPEDGNDSSSCALVAVVCDGKFVVSTKSPRIQTLWKTPTNEVTLLHQLASGGSITLKYHRWEDAVFTFDGVRLVKQDQGLNGMITGRFLHNSLAGSLLLLSSHSWKIKGTSRCQV